MLHKRAGVASNVLIQLIHLFHASFTSSDIDLYNTLYLNHLFIMFILAIDVHCLLTH